MCIQTRHSWNPLKTITINQIKINTEVSLLDAFQWWTITHDITDQTILEILLCHKNET